MLHFNLNSTATRAGLSGAVTAAEEEETPGLTAAGEEEAKRSGLVAGVIRGANVGLLGLLGSLDSLGLSGKVIRVVVWLRPAPLASGN